MSRKKRGRPATGAGTQFGIRWRDPVLEAIDEWRRKQPDLPTRSEAVRRLMRNILFFAEDAELVDKVFESACEFVERVPVQRLTFVPDPTVWGMVQ